MPHIVGVSRHALVSAVEMGGPNLYAETAAQYLATHLLSQHSTWFDESADRRNPGPLTDSRLARVFEFMSARFHTPLSLQRLAPEAGISKFHFVLLFKEASGETPHEWLVTLRMRAARQMLRSSDLTLSAIAAASGYASAARFSRAFVRNTGYTPTQFRSSAQRSARRAISISDPQGIANGGGTPPHPSPGLIRHARQLRALG